MEDKLQALAATLADKHADRVRLQADVERLATELELAQRPWWHSS